MELVKLVKLMMLTTSSNDNEALMAIRMANLILDSNNLNWEQFVSQKTIIVQEVQRVTNNGTENNSTIPKQGDTNIEKMLTECMVSVSSPSRKKFIRSLYDWYKNKGYLTKKQEETLRNWYNNL